MINNRNITIDFIKGLLIYLVVLGHTLSGQYMAGISTNIEESLRFLIYLFHMPLFFFLSGYLIKTEKLQKKYISEKIKYIGILFLVSSLIYMFVFSSVSFKSFVLLITSPYNHLWFLEVLIIYFFVIYLIKNLDYKMILFLTIILAIIGTGFRDLGSTIFNQFGYKPIFRGMEYFIYFYLGYILRNQLINIKLLETKKVIFLLVTSIVFLIINVNINIFQINFYISFAFGFVLFNILLIFFINNNLKIELKNNFIIEAGQASLFIYLWHYGFIVVALHLSEKLELSNLYTDLLLSIIIFIILIYVNRYLSRFDYFKYIGVR